MHIRAKKVNFQSNTLTIKKLKNSQKINYYNFYLLSHEFRASFYYHNNLITNDVYQTTQ